jgi:hypothetical protein
MTVVSVPPPLRIIFWNLVRANAQGLLQRQPVEARQMLRRLLVGRLAFTMGGRERAVL